MNPVDPVDPVDPVGPPEPTPIQSFCLSGMSTNPCNTGDGAFSLGAGADVYDQVLNMSESQARAALNALSGEIYASVKALMLRNTNQVRAAALARLRDSEDDELWVEVLSGEAKLKGHRGAASLSSREAGILVGMDRRYGDWRAGAFAGYSQSDFDVDHRNSSGDADNIHVGVYGGKTWNQTTLRAGLTHSWHDITIERRALGQKLEGDRDARSVQAFVEVGHRIGEGTQWVEPFAGLAWVNHKADGVREKGGSAALDVKGGDSDVGFTTLGVRGGAALDTASPARVYASFGWQHAFGDTDPESRQAFDGGERFTVHGTSMVRNAAVVEAGVSMGLSENAKLSLGYSGQFGGGNWAQTGQMRVSVRF